MSQVRNLKTLQRLLLRGMMRRRNRKLIGTIVILSFFSFYALLAMTLAQTRPVQEAPEAFQAAFYVIFGMAWVLPIMPLIKWMERPDC